jgi:TRAP transporter TAXI family solute receptor
VALAPGTRLGAYEIQSLIGSGGMGEVYCARDSRLNRDVAIKVLPADVASDTDRLTRFETEARATATLNHPNILAVYDVGEAEGVPYVVSELLDGQTLRGLLIARRLPVPKIIDYAAQIADGLAAAHARGIVHRDLKPENVLITQDGRVKILDFGLAKLTDATVLGGPDNASVTRAVATIPGIVLGTVGYMSPEQVRGQAVDYRSDVFSFGVMLYEMVSGERPFKGATSADTMSAILNAEPPALHYTSAAPVPLALERLVRRCLEKSVDDRFQSAKDLVFALTVSDSKDHRGWRSATVPLRERYIWATSVVCLLAFVAILLLQREHGVAARPTIRLATTGPAKIAQLVGSEMGAVLTRAAPTWDVDVKETDGSVDVVKQLDHGEANVGFVNSVVAFQAVKTDRVLAHRNDTITGVAVLWRIEAQIFAAENSLIRRIEDLRGKRVSLGLDNSGDRFCSEILLQHYGVDPAQLRRVPRDPAGSVDGVLDGSLDAAIIWQGVPAPDVTRGFETGRFRFLSLDADAFNSLHLKNPFINAFTISPRVYPHQPSPVLTVQTKMLLVALRSVSAEVIETMLRAFADHIRDLIAAHPAATEILLQRMPTVDDGMSIELHPGAERFYRSQPKP